MLDGGVLDAFEWEKVGDKGIRRRWLEKVTEKDTIVEQLNEVRTMDLEGKS